MKNRTQLMFSVLIAILIISGPATQWGHAQDDKAKAAPASADAEEKPAFANNEEKVSYIVGSQIGQFFKSQDAQVNLNALLKGIKDAQAGKDSLLTQGDMQKAMEDFRKQAGEKQLKEGQKFLANNKTKESVIELLSGLQYKVIIKGTGATPTKADKVKTNYRGTLVNGEEFDNSYKRGQPAEFPVTGVIPGWTEALLLMSEGAKWELYIPASLAYRAAGRPGIPPNSTLIFELELLEVIKPSNSAITIAPAPAGK